MAKASGCLKLILGAMLVAVFLGLGVWFLGNLNRVLTHDTTEGVVVELVRSTGTDGDTVYAPIYELEVAGQTYRYESQVSYGGVVVPEIGDIKTLLYNPDDPSDARVRNMFVLLALPLILMAIPLLIVMAIVRASIRRRRRSTEVPTQLGQTTPPPWAEQAAQPPWDPPVGSNRSSIEAMFMGTEPSQMDARGRVRYRVKARAEIDGSLHRFLSEWLEEDPTLYYMKHGNKVEVRIDPQDPTSYEVVLPPLE